MREKAADNPDAGLARLIREIRELERLIRDSKIEPVPGSQGAHGSTLLALTRLAPGLSSEEWRDMAHSAGLEAWMALPLDGDAFPLIGELHERLERLARKCDVDLATGLPNKARFLRALSSEAQRARRQNSSLALAVLRIRMDQEAESPEAVDNSALVAGRVLDELKRGFDVAARLDQSTMALLMPGADKNLVRSLLGSMRRKFGEQSIDTGALLRMGAAMDTGPTVPRGGGLLAKAQAAYDEAEENGEDLVLHRLHPDKDPGRATMVRSSEKKFLFGG